VKLTIVSDDGAVVRLRLLGPLNQSVLLGLPDPISSLLGTEAYAKKVIVDMREVEFVDSSGLGWLLACNKQFRNAHGRLVIHSLPPVVLDMMKVMGLERVLSIAADEQAALAMISEVNRE